METIFINSIDDLFIRKHIQFSLINLMHEKLKLYIPDDDYECNLILKVCALFVNIRLHHEIKLNNRIILNKNKIFKSLKI